MVFKSAQIFSSFLWYSLKNLLSLSLKFVHIGHQFCLCFFNVLQQFVYKIISRTLLSGTYCTQYAELLIPFCNGNSIQKFIGWKTTWYSKKHTNKCLTHFRGILWKICSHWTSILSLFPILCSVASVCLWNK